MKTLNSKATTPEGKLYSAQLASVVSFYNKTPIQLENMEVNWEQWSSRITTKGLVDKIKLNTDTLLKEKYQVSQVAEKVTGEPSEEYSKIVK